MNNINNGRSKCRTHEAIHHAQINCQISSDLIAYYVMSVHADEYKRDNVLCPQYTGRNWRHLCLMTMYVGAIFANHFKYQ